MIEKIIRSTDWNTSERDTESSEKKGTFRPRVLTAQIGDGRREDAFDDVSTIAKE